MEALKDIEAQRVLLQSAVDAAEALLGSADVTKVKLLDDASKIAEAQLTKTDDAKKTLLSKAAIASQALLRETERARAAQLTEADDAAKALVVRAAEEADALVHAAADDAKLLLSQAAEDANVLLREAAGTARTLLRAAIETARELFARVKVLEGVLPVCMHCKKIRDEAGRWERFEAYISLHSEADFSHGICPECVVKHYPEQKLSD